MKKMDLDIGNNGSLKRLEITAVLAVLVSFSPPHPTFVPAATEGWE